MNQPTGYYVLMEPSVRRPDICFDICGNTGYYVLMDPEERRLDVCLATPCIFSSQRAVYSPPKVQNFGLVSVNNKLY